METYTCIFTLNFSLASRSLQPGEAHTNVLYTGTSSLSGIPNFCKVMLLTLIVNAAARWEEDWLCHFIPILSVQSSELHLNNIPLHTTIYILHDHILETETSTKYLGVTLQNDLKWNKQIRQHYSQCISTT